MILILDALCAVPSASQSKRMRTDHCTVVKLLTPSPQGRRCKLLELAEPLFILFMRVGLTYLWMAELTHCCTQAQQLAAALDAAEEGEGQGEVRAAGASRLTPQQARRVLGQRM